jgi:hypothetical protein
MFKKTGYKIQKKMSKLVEKLAGSVKVADEYKGLNLNQMVEKAKNDYFSKK